MTSTALTVKVAEIDGQHKTLIRIVNDLNDAMKAGKAKEALSTILQRLADYTLQHFLVEENYFNKFNYMAASTHKIEHNRFVRQISDFKKKFESGKTMLSIEVMDFLKNWIVKHIQGSDQKYSTCFNQNGLS